MVQATYNQGMIGSSQYYGYLALHFFTDTIFIKFVNFVQQC